MWVCCYRVLHFCMQICIISQISKQSKKYWKNLIIFSLCKVCYFTVLGPTLIIESLQSMLANTFELMLIENGFQELLELAISPEDAEPTFKAHTPFIFKSEQTIRRLASHSKWHSVLFIYHTVIYMFGTHLLMIHLFCF